VLSNLNHPSIYLSVVIPAYNEEDRLPATLRIVEAYLSNQNFGYEIIVVDDGSEDATSEAVQTFRRSYPSTRLIRYAENSGKGHAVKTGVLEAFGNYVLVYDADGATPINEIERLLDAVHKNLGAIVIGSRAKPSDKTYVLTKLHRKIIGRFFNLLLFVLTPGLEDTQCGFKLFPREIAALLFSHQTLNGFAFDVEILHMAFQNQIPVIEVPINWMNKSGSKVNVLIDSWIMLAGLLKIGWLSLLGYYQLNPQRHVIPESEMG
jgi:dolichyl-phosphate beta-glucosyltransferase